jgi:hypothetical protein
MADLANAAAQPAGARVTAQLVEPAISPPDARYCRLPGGLPRITGLPRGADRGQAIIATRRVPRTASR